MAVTATVTATVIALVEFAGRKTDATPRTGCLAAPAARPPNRAALTRTTATLALLASLWATLILLHGDSLR